MTEAIAGDLNKIGIWATVRSLEIGTFITQVTRHDIYPAYLSGWSAITFETGHLLKTILHSKGFFSNYVNPQLDALI